MTERLQAIYDIAALCAVKGLRDAVVSPGSRCAPLTLAFARHDKIKTKTISDERSAGFIALGIAQRTTKPVALVCTSGSAAYNYAPAIAEAFFSQTPLIVFTADRPVEWIAQHDGQTIFQYEIFGMHVKKSFQLPQEYDHPDNQWGINRIVNEAINVASQEPRGPVHINVPLREPLYPSSEKEITFSKNIRIIESIEPAYALPDDVRETLANEWNTFSNVLIVGGQTPADSELIDALREAADRHALPVVGDILSNLHAYDQLIRHTDLFLGQAPDSVKEALRPDLLITFGQSVISKNLKLFLRAYPARAHWHIQPAGNATDTFQQLTRIIPTTAVEFMDFLRSLKLAKGADMQKQRTYQQAWLTEERRAITVLENHFPQDKFGELEVVKELLSQLPRGCKLHLANSMSVRYANFIGLTSKQKVQVFCNRGTSGIDGCVSTAVGHSLNNDIPNILITGDMAFFYDRNAFWNNYPVPNLHIVVLNNHGGIIFNLIDGPAALPEAREYFITQQNLNADKLCDEYVFDYLKLDSRRKTKSLLSELLTFDGTTKVLEFESDVNVNKTLFDKLKQQIKTSYEL
jgi:2-succinyl-5-enolpyruvyl-6-hydroxy-3-cyclohexene-1-carboxylate synthase